MVEQRIGHIQRIFETFERDDRDQALMDAANGGSASCPWSAAEWAAMGATKERDWIRADLECWAQRVAERNDSIGAEAEETSHTDEGLGLRDSATFGVDFRQNVKKLRDLGLRMLQLASLGEQRQLTVEALRAELDASVGAVAGLSSVVDRGLRTTSAKVEVHQNEVHKASALQQRLITKQSVQLAQQEALIATLRREADEQHEALLRAEERINAAKITMRRSRATECNITLSVVSHATQTTGGGSSETELVAATTLGRHVPVSAASLKSNNASMDAASSSVSQSGTMSPLLSRHSTTRGPFTLSLKPHELLIAENKLQQMRFFCAAAVALYRKSAKKMTATRPTTRATQTDESAPSKINTSSEWRDATRLCYHLLQQLLDRLAGNEEATSAVFTDVVDAIDVCMSSTHVDLIDTRARCAALAERAPLRRAQGAPEVLPLPDTDTTSHCDQTKTAMLAAPCRPPSSIKSKQAAPGSLPVIDRVVIGEPIGPSAMSLAAPEVATESVPGIPKESPQHALQQTLSSARLPSRTSSNLAALQSMRLHKSSSTQTDHHTPRSAPTLQAGGRQTPFVSVTTQTEQPFSAFNFVRPQKVLTADCGSQYEGAPRANSNCESVVSVKAPETVPEWNAASEFQGSSQVEQRDQYRVEDRGEYRRTRQFTTMEVPLRRPSSAVVLTAKPPTSVAPSDALRLAHMQSRVEANRAEFESIRVELERLRQLDAERALFAPEVEPSSHHFRVPHRERVHEPISVIPAKPSQLFNGGAQHDQLPADSVLTPRGIVEVSGDHLNPSLSARSCSRVTLRPSAFHVPSV